MTTLILGAGITGLTIGFTSGHRVFEGKDKPGGLSTSYYMRPNDPTLLATNPAQRNAFRFEVGGGHWIYGGDMLVRRFLSRFSPLQEYERRSSVFLPDLKVFAPYPLQYNLNALGPSLGWKSARDMFLPHTQPVTTMRDWLYQQFGPTLYNLFFGPFHERYMATLVETVAPQDNFKTPVDMMAVIDGLMDNLTARPAGYNTTFLYPVTDLGAMTRYMAGNCDMQYNKRAMVISPERHRITFSDWSTEYYDTLVSTLPLDVMMNLTGLSADVDEGPDPYTSAIILNIGAERGWRDIKDHWVYYPGKAGFHRVGFYSNVDRSFLPEDKQDACSIYVERSILGAPLPDGELWQYITDTTKELQDNGFIGAVSDVSPVWVPTAYTWQWPGSNWRAKSLALLEQHDIIQAGRYGRWQFQGIAASVREGLTIGGAL